MRCRPTCLLRCRPWQDGQDQRPAALRGMAETGAGDSVAIETAVAEAEESRTIESSAVKTKTHKRYIFVEKSADCFATEP